VLARRIWECYKRLWCEPLLLNNTFSYRCERCHSTARACSVYAGTWWNCLTYGSASAQPHLKSECHVLNVMYLPRKLLNAWWRQPMSGRQTSHYPSVDKMSCQILLILRALKVRWSIFQGVGSVAMYRQIVECNQFSRQCPRLHTRSKLYPNMFTRTVLSQIANRFVEQSHGCTLKSCKSALHCKYP
jgi:hypothetical protein